MSSQLLPIFSQLWNPSANVRIHGGAALVAHLQAAQSEHLALSAVPSLPSSVSANIDANIVTSPGEHGLASDVVYALKRLIRGLASPRESSRLGFAVALTEASFFAVDGNIYLCTWLMACMLLPDPRSHSRHSRRAYHIANPLHYRSTSRDPQRRRGAGFAVCSPVWPARPRRFWHPTPQRVCVSSRCKKLADGHRRDARSRRPKTMVARERRMGGP